MKHFISLFILFSITLKAEVKLETYQNTIEQINKLEANQQFRQAALLAASAANQVAEEIRLSTVELTVETRLNEIKNEIIVKEKNQNASASLFFGLLSGSAFRTHDVTKIITANPEEVSGFPRKTANDFRKLQSDLVSYLKANELSIFYAKIFAAKSIQLAAKSSAQELNSVIEFIAITYKNVAQFSFVGEQHINTCTTTNFANTFTAEGLKISGIFSLNLSQSEEQFAHSESSCATSVKQFAAAESHVISERLFVADLALRAQLKNLSLIQLNATAPEYPTWGSPYTNKK